MYCLKFRKKQKPKTQRLQNQIKEEQVMYNSKKSIFIKEQEANGLLSNLRLKTPLSKILLLGEILFWMYNMNK